MGTGVRGRGSSAARAAIRGIVAACLVLAVQAVGDEPPRKKAEGNPRPATETGRETSAPGVPDARSFRLGFTPDDLLDTAEVNETVRETLGKHADLVAFHIGRGVPWQESLD